MSKIISIGTAVPKHKHAQRDILNFMQRAYAMDMTESRKLKFVYSQSGIDYRYSVIPDYSREIHDWKFYPHSENLEPFPSLEQRMQYFHKYAAALSVDAIRDCLPQDQQITHLITVSCTGMSAPGLDIQVIELLDLPKNTWRTSINFMGCYAAIHAMKIADAIANHDRNARVMIVCTELCTLHFQHEPTTDNISSALLFGDGSAAALICHDDAPDDGIVLKGFYGEVMPKGKRDMAWELSSSGFLMTLSGYVPELISADFAPFVYKAMHAAGIDNVSNWCIHPGGKRILQAIEKSLTLDAAALSHAYDVLREYGNMSSATILFVLKRHMQSNKSGSNIFGAAFGPGLTMESFVAQTA